MKTKKKPAGRYHHGDLRGALLGSAWKVIEKSGVEGLSLRAVADALGVSHAAPAHHFPTKEALFDALQAEAWRRFADALEASRGDDPLLAAAHAYVKFATLHPRPLELMFRRHGRGPSTPPEVAQHAGRAWQALVERVRAAIGPVRARDAAELDAMTFAAWAGVHGLATLLNEGPLPDGFHAAAMQERVHQVLLAAIRQRR